MEKLFYTISPSTEYAEVGDWMQVEEVYNWTDEVYTDYQNFRFDSKRQELPKKLQFEIKEAAYITDCLSNSLLNERAGLTINKKAKDLFDNFKIGGEKEYIKVQCYQKKKKHNYFLFFLREINKEIIFKDSIFDINDMFASEFGELVSFKNEEAYAIQLGKVFKETEGKFLFPRKLFLKNDIDICRLPNTPSIIVSEAVKLACEKQQLSGFEFEPATCKIIIDN